MRSGLFVWVAVVLLVAGAEPKQEKTAGVFAPLVKGKTVALKEVAGRYEISVIPKVELGHKVVEVGPEFLVLEDIAGTTETRIPVYSVRAVTVLRQPKK